MRRAVLVLGSTAAGLAALFSFKSHVAGVAVASTSPATPAAAASSSPAASPLASAAPSKTAKRTPPKPAHSPAAPAKTAPATTAPTTAPPSKKPTAPAPTKSSPPPAPSGTFTGPNEDTQYGPVQVRITVAGGKITEAADVQQPADSIGANAVSQLNSEVLTAQSANVQAVSGATYTSGGYIKSLQQAVDQAGL
jgi:uncharacterized protein with FMN-binding domain